MMKNGVIMTLKIDPEMRYCLACDDEYMPHINKCGVCGADLITGRELLVKKQSRESELASRLGDLTEDDEIVTIFKAKVEEVKRIERLLKAENIGTLIVGDENTCGQGCCGGNVELRVRVQDARDAMTIIETDLDRTTMMHEHTAYEDHGFNQEAKEHSCPACGTVFSTSETTCPDCGLCFG